MDAIDKAIFLLVVFDASALLFIALVLMLLGLETEEPHVGRS